MNLHAMMHSLRQRFANRLIAQMNSKVSYRNSSKTPAWRAYRRAEKLSDAKLLPVLREIILKNPGKEGTDVREAAYFIMARLLAKVPDSAMIAFYIGRIAEETGRDVRIRMLTHLGRVRIPLSQPMDTLIEMTKDADRQLRESAIFALGCQDSDRCRQALRGFVALHDHKAHRDDVLWAQAALMKIGQAEDIALFERNTHSPSRNIRESAAFGVQKLRERTGR